MFGLCLTIRPPTQSYQGCSLPCHTLLAADDAAGRQALLQLYDALSEAHPKSLACQRIPLGFLDGEVFAARADAYMRTHLQR